MTLQTSTYNAGPAEVTALLAGSLDAAYMGPNSAITAYSQGKGAITDHLRRHLGRSGAGGLPVDHLGQPAQAARPSPRRSSATPRTWPCAPG